MYIWDHNEFSILCIRHQLAFFFSSYHQKRKNWNENQIERIVDTFHEQSGMVLLSNSLWSRNESVVHVKLCEQCRQNYVDIQMHLVFGISSVPTINYTIAAVIHLFFLFVLLHILFANGNGINTGLSVTFWVLNRK